MIFTKIKTNITSQEAELAFPNDYIFWLAPERNDNHMVGDVVFVGDEWEVWDFVEGAKPPEGLFFYMLYGVNQMSMSAIQVV